MDSKGSMQSVTGSKNALYMNDIKFKEGSWWERRSSLEKKLVVLAVLLLVLSIILVVLLVVFENRNIEAMAQRQTAAPTLPSQLPQPEICTTPTCIETAARILYNGNFSADPCEDFYQFSCGAFMQKTVIDEDKNTNDIFSLLTDRLDVKLKIVIEATPKPDEPKAVKTAKDLYKSCIDLDTIEARGADPLLESLSELGGWPVLDSNWTDTTFDLETSLVKASQHNQVPIIYMAVSSDIANSSIYKIYFDQPGLGMPSRDYFLKERNDTSLMGYQNYITRVAVALGADPDAAKAEIAELVDFEIKLANITVPAWERYDQSALYNVRTLAQMAENYTQFDWLRYTQMVMSGEGVGIDITEDEQVVNYSPQYFEQLFQILEDTPKKVQANYIVWKVVQQRVKLLSSTFRDFISDYNEILTGLETEPPRWKVCLRYVNTVMNMATARLYSDEFFDEQSKTRILEMIAYLRTAFNELLDGVDWMDDATRQVAREKAAVMSEKIGYPDAIRNSTYLNDLYKKQNFSDETYFENVVLDHKLAAIANLNLLRKSVDRTKWLVAPVIVNAFYYRTWNEIVFPAGILQPPFYSKDQPWSINFGGMGSVIGHEITHGFDNRGRQADKYGNLRQWWADDVIERFNNETKCFIDQTSQYTWPEAGMKVNGELTVSEDVADGGGMKQSYRAYRKFVSEQGKEEPQLPGLPFTNNQLFFISWAQVWCSKIRPKTAQLYILIDYHSPNRYRALAPMMNMPEFSEAFNCPAGAPMNPKDKCSVW